MDNCPTETARREIEAIFGCPTEPHARSIARIRFVGHLESELAEAGCPTERATAFREENGPPVPAVGAKCSGDSERTAVYYPLLLVVQTFAKEHIIMNAKDEGEGYAVATLAALEVAFTDELPKKIQKLPPELAAATNEALYTAFVIEKYSRYCEDTKPEPAKRVNIMFAFSGAAEVLRSKGIEVVRKNRPEAHKQ